MTRLPSPRVMPQNKRRPRATRNNEHEQDTHTHEFATPSLFPLLGFHYRRRGLGKVFIQRQNGKFHGRHTIDDTGETARSQRGSMLFDTFIFPKTQEKVTMNGTFFPHLVSWETGERETSGVVNTGMTGHGRGVVRAHGSWSRFCPFLLSWLLPLFGRFSCT